MRIKDLEIKPGALGIAKRLLMVATADYYGRHVQTILKKSEVLADFSYTKEELEQLKATLPKELQDAVDMLTLTVSEAKKVLKNDN